MAATHHHFAGAADGAAAFRELADRILSCDAHVFLAYNVRQARQLRQHLGAVTVVDLDATGVQGLLLIRRLREQNPDRPVVAVSTVLGVS